VSETWDERNGKGLNDLFRSIYKQQKRERITDLELESDVQEAFEAAG